MTKLYFIWPPTQAFCFRIVIGIVPDDFSLRAQRFVFLIPTFLVERSISVLNIFRCLQRLIVISYVIKDRRCEKSFPFGFRMCHLLEKIDLMIRKKTFLHFRNLRTRHFFEALSFLDNFNLNMLKKQTSLTQKEDTFP